MEYSNSINIFTRCMKYFPKNKEPYLLKSIASIQGAASTSENNDMVNVDDPKKRKKIEQAIRYLNQAIV